MYGGAVSVNTCRTPDHGLELFGFVGVLFALVSRRFDAVSSYCMFECGESVERVGWWVERVEVRVDDVRDRLSVFGAREDVFFYELEV